MIELQKIIDKINELPDHLHEEVYNYVDFLLNKYKKENRLALTSKERMQLELSLGIAKSNHEMTKKVMTN